MQEPLFDITTVCRLLHTTSRTLRYYEQAKLIDSTKSSAGGRRAYTREQVDAIRDLLTLRSLGLSVKDIASLRENGGDLRSVILSRRVEILAEIASLNRRIRLLSEALAVVEEGGSVFAPPRSEEETTSAQMQIVKICGRAIVAEDLETLYSYFSGQMLRYLPQEVYRNVWADTVEPLGEFVSLGAAFVDQSNPHVLYQRVNYEKAGLKIKFVIREEKIHGLYLLYDFREPQNRKEGTV